MDENVGMTNCPFCKKDTSEFEIGKITLLRYDDSVTPIRKHMCEIHGDLIWDSEKKQFNLPNE